MIYDKMKHISRYKFSSSALNEAIVNIESGNEIIEDSVFFKNNIISFNTELMSHKQAEYHRKYIDIHIVLEGKEYVEVGHIDQLSECTMFDEQNDIGFGNLNTVNKFQGYLSPEYFLIVFPEDAHLVGAHTAESEHVQKMVYKIPVE